MTEAEEAQSEALADLDGVAMLSVRDGRIVPELNMSDTFGYACADSEDVPIDALPLVARMWREYGHDGLTAWAAVRRGQEPIPPRSTPEYLRAHAELLSNTRPA